MINSFPWARSYIFFGDHKSANISCRDSFGYLPRSITARSFGSPFFFENTLYSFPQRQSHHFHNPTNSAQMSYLFTPYQPSSFSYMLKSSHPDKHHLPALQGILFILKVSNNLRMTIYILFHGAFNYSFSHPLRFSNFFSTFILVSSQMTVRKIVLPSFIYLFVLHHIFFILVYEF